MNDNITNLSLKKRAKTFYFASLFFSREKQNDIRNLYSFCRLIDDLADNNNCTNKKAKIKLEGIKNELKKNESNDQIISDFTKLISKYKINPLIAIDLINGVLYDLNKVNIKSFDQLFDYSYKVAGTVGLMMCKIMEVKNNSVINEGVYLGIAMQLTNISRDIKEDLEDGRIYFPKEIRNNVSGNFKKLLTDKKLQIKFSKDLKLLLDTSDQVYNLAWRGVIRLPIKYRIPIAIASYLYQSIGKKIKKNGYNVWNQRVYLSMSEKIIKTGKVFLKLIFDRKDYCNKSLKKQIDKTLKNLNFTKYYEKK